MWRPMILFTNGCPAPGMLCLAPIFAFFSSGVTLPRSSSLMRVPDAVGNGHNDSCRPSLPKKSSAAQCSPRAHTRNIRRPPPTPCARFSRQCGCSQSSLPAGAPIRAWAKGTCNSFPNGGILKLAGEESASSSASASHRPALAAPPPLAY